VGVLKRDTGARQSLGQIRGYDPARGGGLGRLFGIEPGRPDDRARHLQTTAQRVGGVEQAFFILLHIAIVSHRKTFHGHK